MTKPSFRFSVMPFLLAFVAGLAGMTPTSIVTVNAQGFGIEREEPWRSRSAAGAVRSFARGVSSLLQRLNDATWFRPALAIGSAGLLVYLQPEVSVFAPMLIGAALTEGKHAGEFILSEAEGSRSRENVTVLSGENLKAGHVLGRRLVAPTVAAAVAFGTNTGNGTVTGQAVGTNLGAQRGNYRLTFVEPNTNLGNFLVFDPSGQLVGDGVVGTLFDNQIQFTVNDGGTDFVAGDAFTIAVSAGTYKYKEYDAADADGGQRVAGVLYDNVDASAADKAGVGVVRDAEIRKDDLTWFAGATNAQKDAALDALAALGVISRN